MIFYNFCSTLNFFINKKTNFFIYKYYKKIINIIKFLHNKKFIKNFSIIYINQKYYIFIELFIFKKFKINLFKKNMLSNYNLKQLVKLKNNKVTLVLTTWQGLKTLQECCFFKIGGKLFFSIL